jgi:hypothetical protein
MFSWMLTLAAGISLIFGLNGFRTAVILIAGLVCALASNAFRAVLLYAGYAGLAPFGFQQHESATGLFCFALFGIPLVRVARRMEKKPVNTGGIRSHSDRRRRPSRLEILAAIAFLFICAASSAWILAGRGSAAALKTGGEAMRWPSSWEGYMLAPARPDEATELFKRDFPGEFMEFSMVSRTNAEEGYFPEAGRIVMRFVRSSTRRLHPAEDCFRGAGYRITPAPIRIDRNGRRWSGFSGEKSGRAVAVRQCVISIPDGDLASAETSNLSWPDVSSWYWDTARPGAKNSPAAMAVTVVEEL